VLEIAPNKNMPDISIAALGLHHIFSAITYASISQSAQLTVHLADIGWLVHGSLPHLTFILIFDAFFTTFGLEGNFEAYPSLTLSSSFFIPVLSLLSAENSQSISSKTNFSAFTFLDH
jgi:hypothetical protein